MKISIYLFGLLSLIFAGCDSTDEPATDNNDNSENVTFDHNEKDFVDLGLPSGNLWAIANLGGVPFVSNHGGTTIFPDAEDLIGDYFAWGELCKKDVFNPENYAYSSPLSNGNGFTFDNIGANISDTSYDVAKYHWGGDWQMPDLEDYRELIEYCTFDIEWYAAYDHRIILVVGPNGKRNWFYVDSRKDSTAGCFLSRYWTSEAVAAANGSAEPGLYAYALEIDENNLRITSEHPKYEMGLVRPVIKPKKK